MNESQNQIVKQATTSYNLDEVEGSVRLSPQCYRHKTIGRLLKVISELEGVLGSIAELTRYKHFTSKGHVPNDKGPCVSYEKLTAILEQVKP